MGGVLSTIKKKAVAAFSYAKKKISDFLEWLPDWVKWLAMFVGIAVIGWFAIPYIIWAAPYAVYAAAACYTASVVFGFIWAVIVWLFGQHYETNYDNDGQYHIQIPYSNTNRQGYYVHRDNGHSWYHQPNIRNSYGWNRKPM